MSVLKFVLSIELNSFIFEIIRNYIAILFKVMRRKQTSKISQFFTCEHKINKSNAKITTHYWIDYLHSKNVCFYVFISNKIFNFFRNMFGTKTIEINDFISFTKQSNPMCNYVCILIKVYYISSILYFSRQIISWKNSIKSWPILIILLYFKVCHEATLEIPSFSLTSSYKSFPFFISKTSSYNSFSC